MSDTTGIEWCDSTFNPWIGCAKVSPGCDHCYAAEWDRRFAVSGHAMRWGPKAERTRTSDANWRRPMLWEKREFSECMGCGWRGEFREALDVHNPVGFHPPVERSKVCPRCREPLLKEARRRVFCASLADVFDNEVPTLWRVELLTLIGATEKLDWLLLTKRIGNVKRLLCEAAELAHERGLFATAHWITSWVDGDPPPHVWLGATVVNQAEADRDIPKLLSTPAAVRFLSVEPMLGPIDLTGEWLTAKLGAYPFKNLPREHRTALLDLLDWVICGGESGPKARPMHPGWPRSLRDQCSAAGVPFLFKQHGEWLPTAFCEHDDRMLPSRRTVYVSPDGSFMPLGSDIDFFGGAEETAWVGKRAAGSKLDGVECKAWPA